MNKNASDRSPSIESMCAEKIQTALGLVAAYYSEFDYRFCRETIEKCITDLIASPSLGQLFLLMQNEVAAGYMLVTYGFSFEYSGRDAFIDELFVLPAYRNVGIGRKAVEFALEHCMTGGIGAVHLEVKRNSINALRLYRSFGFIEHDGVLASCRLL